jgi:hypothetical protein
VEGPEPVAVQLQSLPAPDTLEFDLPPGHVCLVSGDGTSLTTTLVRNLSARGWPVVLLQPATHGEVAADLPGQIPVVTLTAPEEGAVRDALAAVALHGSVGTVVILPSQLEADEGPWNTESLRVPFLLAKYLQPALNAAAASFPNTRAGFVTVTRMDGALGLAGNISAHPVSAGILGLTKSLRLEWPEVFCRAIDLDPAMEPEAAAGVVLGELFDPDRLTVEVGWGSQGRVTLIAGPSGAIDGGQAVGRGSGRGDTA